MHIYAMILYFSSIIFMLLILIYLLFIFSCKNPMSWYFFLLHRRCPKFDISYSLTKVLKLIQHFHVSIIIILAWHPIITVLYLKRQI